MKINQYQEDKKRFQIICLFYLKEEIKIYNRKSKKHNMK